MLSTAEKKKSNTGLYAKKLWSHRTMVEKLIIETQSYRKKIRIKAPPL